MKTKTIDILQHISSYCDDIEKTISRFGKSHEIFEQDKDYRNSICMSLLQIGELTGHLPEDFRASTKGTIYWSAIKGMRNLFAHNYGAVDIGLVWETAIADIPILHKFCSEAINMYYALEQEVKISEDAHDLSYEWDEEPSEYQEDDEWER